MEKKEIKLEPALDIEGNEIGIGDEVAYATTFRYKAVVKKTKVTNIQRWGVIMGKCSCPKGQSVTRILIIKKAA